jgi:pseudouridine-5'-phosphate glycosidase
MDISGKTLNHIAVSLPHSNLLVADLTELGRTPVAVISSGSKSFLDLQRTLEYLETQGVVVGAFADGRNGHVDFPAFFTRDSGIKAPKVIQDEMEAAAIICKFLWPGYFFLCVCVWHK